MVIIKRIGIFISLIIIVVSCGHNFNTKTPREIRTHLQPNTVWVGNYIGTSHGSGSIMNYNGFRAVVTNSHVCQIADNEGNLFIKMNLETKLEKVKVLLLDKLHDICLTTVPKTFRSHGLKLGIQPHEGDSVYVLGFPTSNRKTFVFGEWTGETTITIAYPYTEDECPGEFKSVASMFGIFDSCFLTVKSGEITSSIFPGSSGSPVVDNRGFVVGIIFAGNSDSILANFMIPSRYIRELFKTIVGK